ncbi:uncharacterized protein FSUBG_11858 [Fusarium subglutinans]|uniref:Uncharacterized protein n=1 Tax=Gibberella subglutinans TaxID=42677 RepID=A0A8H5P409_GIBSU|nr:uncharacterized protein FSUBG_11858 [Fusarium subglutinans]KAF5587318.1 hypothetical protein FSUBG_11858 [Fusarium subglutinans]
MDFNELVASRAELEAAISEIQGKVTDLWRINHQQDEKIKELEKQNEDQNVKFEATRHKLTRTEVTIRALEAKVKLQKANLEDLKGESQQQQDEIKALKTQEQSKQLKYAAKVLELKREKSDQASKIAQLEKAKTGEVSGVKANFSFLQSKLVRAEAECKDRITELNSKHLEQKVKMGDCIKELKSQKEDQEAEIETLKDHLRDKENLVAELLAASQTKDSSWETQSQRIALLEAQIEALEVDKRRQDSRSEELEMKYSTETFRREKLQKQLKLNEYDVDQVHEIAQSLEFHFNSTYVRFSGDNKLHTKAELEEAYKEAQRLQDKRRALVLARRMRIHEEEDRERSAYSEE